MGGPLQNLVQSPQFIVTKQALDKFLRATIHFEGMFLCWLHSGQPHRMILRSIYFPN